jgi:hypothetical protein
MVAYMTTRSVLTVLHENRFGVPRCVGWVRFAGCHGISLTGRDCGVVASSLPGYANTEVRE